MKTLFAIPLVLTALVAQSAITTSPVTGGVGGSATNAIPLVSGSGTNTALYNARFIGGTGNGLSNLFHLTGVISNSTVASHAFSGTNATADLSKLYVTSSIPAIAGTYLQYWGGVSSGIGVWTNTASTNFIYLNDPGGNIGDTWTLEGVSNSADYYSSANDSKTPNGIWVGTESGGFNGNIGVAEGTNLVSSSAVAFAFSNFIMPPGGSNIIRVETWGDDNLANRTNGYPFVTLWKANEAAIHNAGDVVLIGPGTFRSASFYSKKGVTWKGAGEKVTFLELFTTNWATTAESPGSPPYTPSGFNSAGFVLNSNVVLCDVTITNACIIGSNNPGVGSGQDSVNAYVHDVTVLKPRNEQYFSSDSTAYLNAGVRMKSVTDCTFERVKIYSGAIGFEVLGSIWGTNSYLNLIDCTVICSPEYSVSGTNFLVWNGLNIEGGMQSIAINDSSGSKSNIVINVIGGRYVSLNGGTNNLGSPANTNRNACIYIQDGIFPGWRINIAGAQFVYGSSNAGSAFLLDESTNRASLHGYWHVRGVANNEAEEGTNTFYIDNVAYSTATGSATNAIANTNGFGTNTTLYGTTTFNGTVSVTNSTDTNMFVNLTGGGSLIVSNAVLGASVLSVSPSGSLSANLSGSTNLPVSGLSFTGFDTTPFTNLIAARIPVFTNSSIVYYLVLSTNAP